MLADDDDDDDDLLLTDAGEPFPSAQRARRLHKGLRPKKLKDASERAEERFRTSCKEVCVKSRTVLRFASESNAGESSGRYKRVLRPMLKRGLQKYPERDLYSNKLHFVNLHVEFAMNAAEVTSPQRTVVCLCGCIPAAQPPATEPVVYGVRCVHSRLLFVLGSCCASRAAGYEPVLQLGDVCVRRGPLIDMSNSL